MILLRFALVAILTPGSLIAAEISKKSPPKVPPTAKAVASNSKVASPAPPQTLMTPKPAMPTLSKANSQKRKIASIATFKRYFSKMLETNGTYLQAFNEYRAAREKNSGKSGAYFPSLLSSLSYTKTTPSLTDTYKAAFSAAGQGLDLTKTISGSVALAGKIYQLGMSYSLGVFQNTQTSYIFNDQMVPLSLNPGNSGASKMSLQFNLLKGFGPSVGSIPFDALSISEKASYWQSRAALMSSAESLLNAYIAALLADKQFALTETYYKNSEDFLQRYIKLEAAGQASGLEVLNAKVHVLANRTKRLQSLDQKAIAIESLNRAAGTDDPLEQVGRIDDIADDHVEVPADWMSEKFDPKEIKNPSLQSLRQAVKLAELDVQSAKNGTLPSLSLEYSELRYINGPRAKIAEPLENHYGDSTISLQLTLPLSRAQEYGEFEAKKAALSGRKAALGQAEIDLREKWKSAVRDLNVAESNLKILEETSSVAKQRYDSSVPTMQLSSSAQKDAIDYQTAFQDAQVRVLEAKTTVLKARAKLYFLKGDLTLMEQLAGNKVDVDED